MIRTTVTLLVLLCSLRQEGETRSGLLEPLIPNAFESVQVFADTSDSMCDGPYLTTLRNLASSLPALTCSLGTGTVSVYPFASGIDVWNFAAATVSLPPRPRVSMEEPDLGEAQRIFKRLREKREMEVVEASSKRWEREFGAYTKAIRDSLAPILEILKGLRRGKPDCTALNDFAFRSASESGRTLTIGVTDGLQHCGELLSGSVERDKKGAVTVIFLVPTKSDCKAPGGYAEKFEERAEALWCLLPSAIILPAYMSASFETWLQLIIENVNQASGADGGSGYE